MEGTLHNIALTNIRDHVGTPPSSKLRKSIRRMGVVQPVLLSEHVDESGEIQYVIVDGNRRISAARTARMRTVPAMVLKDLESDQISQLTLILNGYRSANYLTEFWAIRALTKSNFTFDDIQNLSGYATSSMEHRESFASLNRDIFVALRNGKIIQTFASAIAKLPKATQDELAEIYLKRGRLLKRDIDEYSRRSRVHENNANFNPQVITSGTGTDQAIEFSDPVAKSESAKYHFTVPSQQSDLSSTPVTAVPSTPGPAMHLIDAPLAQSPADQSEAAVSVASTPLLLNAIPTSFHGSELSLDDQMAALEELRGHLTAAANIAASFGMDRFDYLAQASRMWDSRGQELQSRLIPQEVSTPVTTTPLAANRASIDA